MAERERRQPSPAARDALDGLVQGIIADVYKASLESADETSFRRMLRVIGVVFRATRKHYTLNHQALGEFNPVLTEASKTVTEGGKMWQRLGLPNQTNTVDADPS